MTEFKEACLDVLENDVEYMRSGSRIGIRRRIQLIEFFNFTGFEHPKLGVQQIDSNDLNDVWTKIEKKKKTLFNKMCRADKCST